MGKKSRRRQNKNKKKNGPSLKMNTTSVISATSGGSEEVVEDPLSSTERDSILDVNGHNHEEKENVEAGKITARLENEVAKDEENEEKSLIPEGLAASLSFLSERQQKLAILLCQSGQSHLFEHWPVPSATPNTPSANAVAKIKVNFMKQLEVMDDGYANRGGLLQYIANAKELLVASARGDNPLADWTPHVPKSGQIYELGTAHFTAMEKVGMDQVGNCGFVLVAGGLGERLGYSGIKLGLPTEMTTETCYLQYYIETILAIQNNYAVKGMKLPLCIMVSNDTNAGTVKLLEDNEYFGMSTDQVSLIQQGDGVPALLDNEARIALDPKDRYKIQAKPHGHGDIHALMYAHGVAEKWANQGIRWAVFCQDTNGLAFHTLPLALGVSQSNGLIMNSLAVPRRAKQAIGAIARLVNNFSGEERTISVEYNQLDTLLRSTNYPKGDVNDSNTGYSPFPGNINQLIFDLDHYVNILKETRGAVPEFVNPKYKDETKTVFKKPTRLECMMQDFSTVINGNDAKFVGYTSVSSDLCFSPVKNATVDGAKIQASGTNPGVAATGEADQYGAIAKILRSIGCNISEGSCVMFDGIKVPSGPSIVFKPNFVLFPVIYPHRFPSPEKIKVSFRSTFVINGGATWLTIESLDLDGALVINCEDNIYAPTIISNLEVKNRGWVKVATDDPDADEVVKMRGYKIQKVETCVITIKRDGNIVKKTKVDPDFGTKELFDYDLSAPRQCEASENFSNDCNCIIL